MLGREPRLPHRTMRWLIIALMLINGVQLVVLQLTINSTASLDFHSATNYVWISLVALILSACVLGYAIARGRNARNR
jgi:hypothetical protein